jgi:ERF superfamily
MTATKTPAIHAAMIAIMRDITAIGKDSKNTAQNFKFRGIDAVYNELHNLLAKHGVVTLPQAGTPVTEERTNKNGTILRFVQIPMTYQFVAEDGSSITCQVIGEGMDSGDKATNKAMAIAHKYALLQTFLIPTEAQEDPDYQSHEVVAKPAAKVAKPVFKQQDDVHAKLAALMDQDHLNEADVFAFLASKGVQAPAGAEYIHDLPVGFVRAVVNNWGDCVKHAFNK